MRGLFSRWLESDGDVRIVRSVADGAQAVAQLPSSQAEVVILDIEMPVMDGLEALPKLLALDPAVKIVMSSTLTRRNAQISLKALTLGASDYITKPESTRGVSSSEEFRRELVEKVKALGTAARNRETLPRPATPTANIAAPKSTHFQLRAASTIAPQVIAIGCSTGGPQALGQILSRLGPSITLPILITQHMPATFTAILAEHLTKIAQRPAKEAASGETPEPGTIYVAPGGYHLLVKREARGIVLHVDDGPAENFCNRPSIRCSARSRQCMAPPFSPPCLLAWGTTDAKARAPLPRREERSSRKISRRASSGDAGLGCRSGSRFGDSAARGYCAAACRAHERETLDDARESSILVSVLEKGLRLGDYAGQGLLAREPPQSRRAPSWPRLARRDDGDIAGR